LQIADPIIGLIVTMVILRITWQSFNTVRTDPGEPDAGEEHDGRGDHAHHGDLGHAHEHG
jgi:hypothetical protein